MNTYAYNVRYAKLKYFKYAIKYVICKIFGTIIAE